MLAHGRRADLSIILTIAYSLKSESVGIVTGCICGHNDTNKSNNFLNLIYMLNNWLIIGTRSVVKLK